MNELTTKPESNLPTHASPLAEMPYLSSKDLVIPRLQLMQATSDAVKARKAAFGDIMDSGSDTVLGSNEKPIEIIPFSVNKIWNIYKGNSKTKPIDREYLRTETVTAQNDSYPYDDFENGQEIYREQVYNVVAVLADDLMGLPYIIAFKRTSRKIGQAVITQMYFRNQKAGLPPYATVMELGAKEEQGDSGSYMVWSVKPKRVATDAEKAACAGWLGQITTAEVAPDPEEKPVEKKATAKKDIPNRAPKKEAVPEIDENEPLPF